MAIEPWLLHPGVHTQTRRMHVKQSCLAGLTNLPGTNELPGPQDTLLVGEGTSTEWGEGVIGNAGIVGTGVVSIVGTGVVWCTGRGCTDGVSPTFDGGVGVLPNIGTIGVILEALVTEREGKMIVGTPKYGLGGKGAIPCNIICSASLLCSICSRETEVKKKGKNITFTKPGPYR